MPDQVQNPNIKFQDKGLAPITPGIDPVPLPKVTDVAEVIPSVANIEPDRTVEDVNPEPVAQAPPAGNPAVPPGGQQPHPLFEKPATAAPGAKSEQRTENREQRKLPKKMIAGIAALGFLVVGLGSGLYLVRQKGAGEIRREAEGPYCAICDKENAGDSCECDSGGKQTGNKCKYAPPECSNLGYTWQPDGACNAGAACASGPTPTGAPGLSGTCPPDPVVWCATFDCPYGDTDGSGDCNPSSRDGFAGDRGATYITQWGDACPRPASDCGQKDKYNAGAPDQSWEAICGWTLIGGFPNCGGVVPTSTPGPPATPTPIPPSATPTPVTISASCESLAGQVSDGAGGWITKTDSEFSAAARPGDRVRFVCTGAKSQGSFTKSAFFINSILHIDDVVKLNDTQFAVEYTIPAAGALTVESVLLHDSKGWVD